ncbi:MAG TPA: FMN-binding negative transcriptional regulator [Candidatus Limnocylindrales bacterium]
MYVPAHFKPDDAQVRELLANHGAADLITVTARGMLATMLPFVYDAPGSRPDAGELGVLLGHVARNNYQWREPAIGEALVIVRGPDAYISPAWYATTREHGRVVPTWNYVTAHVYGRLVIHDDPVWVEALVRRLTDRHEAGWPDRWSVDDAPAAYIAGQLRAIVGIELFISRLEGKFKLSQNRSAEDVDGAIAGLTSRDETAMADAMRRQHRRPGREAAPGGQSSGMPSSRGRPSSPS